MSISVHLQKRLTGCASAVIGAPVLAGISGVEIVFVPGFGGGVDEG